MFSSLKLALLFFFYALFGLVFSQENYSFIYNGFSSSANLTLDGIAEFTSNGLLRLTGFTKNKQGHAFYPTPIHSFNTSPFSFSTTFVCASQPKIPTVGGEGIAFVISPNICLPGALPNQFLGLFNNTDNGNLINHVVAVELDTIQNTEFNDINDNHVGIDINGLISKAAEPAGYFSDIDGSFQNLSLISRKPIQVWIDYDGVAQQMNVTLAPINVVAKPVKPLISFSYDLSLVINQTMYVGFSSSTQGGFTSHFILGWSFKMNGVANPLDLSKLPKLPRLGAKPKSKFLTIGLPIILIVLFSIVVSTTAYHVRRKKKFAEELEDWELEYGPHRFKYKDLYVATKGFRDKGLLGTGGFGSVYRGVLPISKIEIAVKKVSHESKQGMKEFVAEIVSIGRMRHRNIVSLLGYCRRRGELLLVYDYMPNGSLDKYLYNQPAHSHTLNWNQRFRVIKGVASGLFYLHTKWEQVVIHRDIKASNVLLDGDFNARLGDFGLARLYDHGTDPQTTTHVVGTFGYLAPEQSRTGRATASTDVYAFGAFMLEVACGRRPVESRSPPEEDVIILVDWVYSCYNKGAILEAVDTKLGFDYVEREVELVMKLALLCSNSDPKARPSMRQVLLCLEGALSLPEFVSLSDVAMPYLSCMESAFSHFSSSSTSIAESLLSGGR